MASLQQSTLNGATIKTGGDNGAVKTRMRFKHTAGYRLQKNEEVRTLWPIACCHICSPVLGVPFLCKLDRKRHHILPSALCHLQYLQGFTSFCLHSNPSCRSQLYTYWRAT